MKMDYARYQNPDMPPGFRPVVPIIKPERGIEVNGRGYVFLEYIYDSGIFDDDIRTLEDLDLTDDEELPELTERKKPEEKVRIKKEELSDDDSRDRKKDRKRHRDYDRKKKEPSENDRSRHSRRRSPSATPPPPLPPNSPPPLPPLPIDVSQIKKEDPDREKHLFGSYFCDVCNITMNSETTYDTHKNGKKHLKAMKLRNISDTVAKTLPRAATEGQTKYPKPASGVIRTKLNTRAEIQDVIERQVKTPCPGLNLVIEIQGLAEVNYYCEICDSLCSPSSIISHLTGFKHQLRSLKHFKPGIYEDFVNEPKHRIEKQILSILSGVESKQGKGKMTVEKEFLADQIAGGAPSYPEPRSSSSRDRDRPSSSSHRDDDLFDTSRSDFIPDTSRSDFYCRICHSHMNSEAMWVAHINGKRHLTNVKKMPGALPSKTRTIELPNARARLIEKLDYERIDEPVVGLNHIQEVQIPETNSETYQCFLCGGGQTSLDIIDHVTSYKHRSKYLDYIDYPERGVLKGMREGATLNALITQMCQNAEDEHGRGRPSVHVTKSAMFN